MTLNRRTRIKICGLRDADTAHVAAEAGADAIGLVFVTGSPRQVTLDQAKVIVDALPAFVDPIALFVNAPITHIRNTAAALGIGTVQLHGDESPQDVKALAPLRVIKSLPFDANLPTKAIAPWRAAPHNLVAILFDVCSLESGDAAARGGTGKQLDWNALSSLKNGGMFQGLAPMILAGGLNPQNVFKAIEGVRPFGVDVSSGVESVRGIKDCSLISQFCSTVRDTDQKT